MHAAQGYNNSIGVAKAYGRKTMPFILDHKVRYKIRIWTIILDNYIISLINVFKYILNIWDNLIQNLLLIKHTSL